MSTSADNLTALHGIKADLFAATREKGLDTTGRTLENLHELWGGISGGGALQAKTAVPSNVDVEVTPDDGYAALSSVNIAAALNLKPWNIRKGKTLFGVTGTADIAVTTEVPSDIPVSKDDADTAYEEAVGSAPKDEDGNDLDMMTLADDNGNITYGYFLQGAANGSANGTCLYNGVELPDINTVWTDEVKETHPYAVITTKATGTGYNFRVYDDSFYHDTDTLDSNGNSCLVFADGGAKQLYWSVSSADDEWVKATLLAVTVDKITTAGLQWTNTDILNEDGTVYLPASDPIPLDYNTIIRWDGNTEGLVSFEYNGYSWYKVSELIPTADELNGCTVFLAGREECHVISDDQIEDGEKLIAISDVMLVSNGEDSSDLIGVTIPEAGVYSVKVDGVYISLLAYNSTTYPSEFTITAYDPITTDFSAVGWRRLSYHTTGELAGQWTYDDFSTTASSGGNFLKNIIQCSREKLYYNGAEVWPNPDQSSITAEEVTT